LHWFVYINTCEFYGYGKKSFNISEKLIFRIPQMVVIVVIVLLVVVVAVLVVV